MKKWVIIITFFVLLLVSWTSWHIYRGNADYEAKAAHTAVQKAKKGFKINKIESVTYYHGTESYQVIKGIKSGRQWYVWVPDKKSEGRFIERPVKSGITRNQALQALAALHLDVRQIVSVRLGAIKGNPVWEITFLNAGKKYNYVAFYYDTGKEAQRILNI
ncbi:peptidase M4 [Sporolactobacillus sp. THM7-4]|nr:peptidase M4 [Sporolactobacillus sp. THM7-4]